MIASREKSHQLVHGGVKKGHITDEGGGFCIGNLAKNLGTLNAKKGGWVMYWQ